MKIELTIEIDALNHGVSLAGRELGVALVVGDEVTGVLWHDSDAVANELDSAIAAESAVIAQAHLPAPEAP